MDGSQCSVSGLINADDDGEDEDEDEDEDENEDEDDELIMADLMGG